MSAVPARNDGETVAAWQQRASEHPDAYWRCLAVRRDDTLCPNSQPCFLPGHSRRTP